MKRIWNILKNYTIIKQDFNHRMHLRNNARQLTSFVFPKIITILS